MSIKGFMGRSRTMWETSHYGGPHKVLYDLPDMNIAPNIWYTANKDVKCDLSYYCKQKLMDLLKDLWLFIKERKKFWLAPIIILLLLLGVLIVIGGSSTIAPFIYTLF